MPNGVHAGELISRVPTQYLKWMVNARHTSAAEAEKEMKRRGTSTPTLEVSGHAIDRASLKFLDVWNRLRSGDEGLWSWLHREAANAHAHGKKHRDQEGRYEWEGLSWRFVEDAAWPVLKTVVSGRNR